MKSAYGDGAVAALKRPCATGRAGTPACLERRGDRKKRQGKQGGNGGKLHSWVGCECRGTGDVLLLMPPIDSPVLIYLSVINFSVMMLCRGRVPLPRPYYAFLMELSILTLEMISDASSYTCRYGCPAYDFCTAGRGKVNISWPHLLGTSRLTPCMC